MESKCNVRNKNKKSCPWINQVGFRSLRLASRQNLYPCLVSYGIESTPCIPWVSHRTMLLRRKPMIHYCYWVWDLLAGITHWTGEFQTLDTRYGIAPCILSGTIIFENSSCGKKNAIYLNLCIFGLVRAKWLHAALPVPQFLRNNCYGGFVLENKQQLRSDQLFSVAQLDPARLASCANARAHLAAAAAALEEEGEIAAARGCRTSSELVQAGYVVTSGSDRAAWHRLLIEHTATCRPEQIATRIHTHTLS